MVKHVPPKMIKTLVALLFGRVLVVLAARLGIFPRLGLVGLGGPLRLRPSLGWMRGRVDWFHSCTAVVKTLGSRLGLNL